MNKIMILLLCIALYFPTQAQSTKCGFDERIDKAILQNPEFINVLNSRESLLTHVLEQRKRSYDNSIVTIPVVVHILHTGQKIGTTVNITNAQVNSAIDQLNKAFSSTGGYSVPSSGIQFALAKRDPYCQSTNGIVRVDANGVCAGGDCYEVKGITGQNELAVKSLSRWPAEDYLNIWVVKEIDDNGAKQGIQGFAQFPGDDPELDGVTILYNAFGYEEDVKIPFDLKSNTRLGTILIHEVGHALGLYHSFEGDDYNRDGIGDRCPSINGCGPFNGDCIADTPPHRRSLGSCNVSGTNVCDGGYSNELYVHNFMDYSSQECQYEFTQGQVDRMKATIEALRSGWKYSSGNLAVNSTTPVTPSCIPQTKYPSNSFGLGIIDFQLGSYIEHSGNTKEDGGYVDHWCSTIGVDPGLSYDLSINTGNQNAQNVRVFIDYNADGDFDDTGESVFSSNKAKLHQGKITIPATAQKGVPLRVRSITAYSGFTISSPCFEPFYGQAEDYTMIIGKPLAKDQPDQNLVADVGPVGANFELADHQEYDVYPNPVSKILNISNPEEKHIRKLEIIDINGKMIQNLTNKLSVSDHLAIDVSSLPSGIHYLRITDDDSVSVKKLSRI